MWWRACAVWRSRFVCYLGVVLVSLTLGASNRRIPSKHGMLMLFDVGFGIAAIVLGDHECPCHQCPCLFPNYLFRPGAVAEISAVLSLGTNVLATTLIGIKAWYVFPSVSLLFVAIRMLISEPGSIDRCYARVPAASGRPGSRKRLPCCWNRARCTPFFW